MIRQRRVRKAPVILILRVPVTIGRRHEFAGSVVAASVSVLRKGIFHAVVVEEVGSVVVVVEIFVAPVMSLNDFARLDAATALAVLALAVSVAGSLSPFDAATAPAVLAVAVSVADSLSRFDGINGCFAIAERGAQVVTVRAGEWALADVTRNPVGC